MKHHTHNDRCLDRPSLRPGRRVPFLGRDLTWNYFRTVEWDWGFMRSRDALPTRYYLSLGHLTLWVGAW